MDSSQNGNLNFAGLNFSTQLIGDMSKTYSLPVVGDDHVQRITGETLKDLMTGQYSHTVDSFTIIDCRYPYEYKGGHISSAINIYRKKEISIFLQKYAKEYSKESRPKILIFHCEFSQKRGPELCAYLRDLDRQLNQDAYPQLTFPELYILEGGYSKFYPMFIQYCSPQGYILMDDCKYEEQCDFYIMERKKEDRTIREMNELARRGRINYR